MFVLKRAQEDEDSVPSALDACRACKRTKTAVQAGAASVRAATGMGQGCLSPACLPIPWHNPEIAAPTLAASFGFLSHPVCIVPGCPSHVIPPSLRVTPRSQQDEVPANQDKASLPATPASGKEGLPPTGSAASSPTALPAGRATNLHAAHISAAAPPHMPAAHGSGANGSGHILSPSAVGHDLMPAAHAAAIGSASGLLAAGGAAYTGAARGHSRIPAAARSLTQSFQQQQQQSAAARMELRSRPASQAGTPLSSRQVSPAATAQQRPRSEQRAQVHAAQPCSNAPHHAQLQPGQPPLATRVSGPPANAMPPELRALQEAAWRLSFSSQPAQAAVRPEWRLGFMTVKGCLGMIQHQDHKPSSNNFLV